jgi:CBS domain-containing protein
MRVADLISSRNEVYSITEDTTVHDAARYLRDRQVRSVGVCDKQKEFSSGSSRKATFPTKWRPRISAPHGCAFPKS